jgi:hypothetical protein
MARTGPNGASVAKTSARNADRQDLVRELVEHVEHAILPLIVRAILDDVVGPHVAGAHTRCPPATDDRVWAASSGL